LTHLNFS